MDLSYTKEDIQRHLTELGYTNIPEEKLSVFMKDLHKLIKYEERKKRIDDKLVELEKLRPSADTCDKENERHASKSKHKKDKTSSRNKKQTRLKVTINEDSYGRSYEDSQSVENSSSTTTDPTLSSRSDTSGSRSRDTLDGHTLAAKSTDESSLYINVNLKRGHSANSLPSLLDKPSSSGFIRVRSASALTSGVGRRSLKTDPVRLHQEYREQWARAKLPGERSHNKLRWAVREWMMGEEPIS